MVWIMENSFAFFNIFKWRRVELSYTAAIVLQLHPKRHLWLDFGLERWEAALLNLLEAIWIPPTSPHVNPLLKPFLHGAILLVLGPLAPGFRPLIDVSFVCAVFVLVGGAEWLPEAYLTESLLRIKHSAIVNQLPTAKLTFEHPLNAEAMSINSFEILLLNPFT